MLNPYQDGKSKIETIKYQQTISNKIYNRINDSENNVNIKTIGNINANKKSSAGHTYISATTLQQHQQQNLPQSKNQSGTTVILNEKTNSITTGTNKNISVIRSNINSIKTNKDCLIPNNLSSSNLRTVLGTTNSNNIKNLKNNDEIIIKKKLKNSIMIKSDITNIPIKKMGEADGVSSDGRKIIDSTIIPDKNIKRISRQNSNASSVQQKPTPIMQQRLRQQQPQQQRLSQRPQSQQQQSPRQQHQRQRHKNTSSSSDKIQQQQQQQNQQKGCENYYSSQSTMHSSRGGDISGVRNVRGSDVRSRPTTIVNRRKRTVSDTTGNRGKQQRHQQISSDSSSSSSDSSGCSGSCCDDGDTSSTSSGEPNLPFPGFPAIALKYFTQDSSPRNLCLRLITNPWFERISILVILLNCITLGMYQPCVDDSCITNRCKILQMFDDIIFAFFALEMVIKMIAMGLYGKNTYLADSWNRLDCFIVFAGLLEYLMHIENLNLTAIRTIRVLRPLRAINRIPSMRILVMLLLDTLPMLGNVLLLCFFVFFIFGIVGVQLWEGILRQRCVLDLPPNVLAPNISFYYEFSKEQDYICTRPEDSGMHLCSNLPPYRIGPMVCNASAVEPHSNYSCINWNQYYTNCTQLGGNPFQGTISFDNIGLAWVAIFLVISLEGWTDIMYYVQDAHSFWDWIYFVLLIVIGSFFMINLCLVVIATQFSETKKREMERMRQERARYTSNSTLASSTNNSEPATCYAEIVKYIAHLWRRFKRRLLKKYRLYKCQRQQKEGLLPNTDNLTFSPSRIKCHHPKCPKASRKPSNIQDQLITVMVPLNSNNNLQAAAASQQHNLIANNNATANITQHHNNNNLSVTGIPQSVGTVNGSGISILNSSSNGSFTGVLIGATSGHNNNNNMNNTNHNNSGSGGSNGHNSSPDISEMSLSLDTISRSSNLKKTTNQYKDENSLNSQKTILLKIPTGTDSEQLIPACASGFLSPPTSARRRSSVMFNEYVILHTPPTIPEPTQDKNVCSSEKMTQAGDGTIWQVNLPQTLGTHNLGTTFTECSELALHDALTCQELLAFSVAFSAALPTGNSTLESFYTSISQHANQQNNRNDSNTGNVIRTSGSNNFIEDYSCCYDLYQNALSPQEEHNNGNKLKKKNRCSIIIISIYRIVSKVFRYIRKYDKKLVEHKYFQQGILLAILINTLSMGIEYHNQPEELTAIVETSNVVFSAIFAVEMLLKVIAEGPFRYVANGFNVFDGIIVILSGIEIIQTFWGDGSNKGSSGLSVLRTFRLLRILKLVRFMPNLRRQLFVMLRTMDNVAVFFSLLVLFIFIFSILGMNLFGCKFCEEIKGERKCDRKNFDSLLWALVTVFQFCKFTDDAGQERECTCPEIISKHPYCECDRKHFNNFLWATVTVFQILTQEDWNVVLFNGMEKTSHWAALYFVALMTFGNYVLFNLLVAILVEGFSSERNERREREQRELVKKLREENMAENFSDILCDELRSTTDSSSTNESYYEIRNKWHSAEELRKLNDAIESQQDKQHHQIQATLDPKCNIQKQRLLQPNLDYQVNDTAITNKISDKDLYKLNDDDRKILKKTYSIKERRTESSKLGNLRPLREPPIIMTTAATPQDSPNTTLESGTTFRNWSQQQLETIIDGNNDDQFLKSHSSPSLLKPPTTLHVERLPSFELIPPSPQMEHKTFNIINNSNNSQQLNLENNNNSISNLEISNINKNIQQHQEQQHKQRTDITTSITITPSTPLTNPKGIDCSLIRSDCNGSNNILDHQQLLNNQQNGYNNNNNELMNRSSSFKVFRRSSSKKKTKQKSNCNNGGGDNNDDEQIILNNGRDNINLINNTNDNLLKRNDSFLRSANRIQNDTKDTNKLSPQNSIRRISSVSESSTGIISGNCGGGNINTGGNIGLTNSNSSVSRRSSCIYNNSQFYQNLNQHNSIKNYSTRRMSSIELALGKSSNLNVYNMENRKSMAFSNSKIDLDKWQKSLSNLNEPDTTSLQQQQQQDEVKIVTQEQRTHSISQQTEHVSKIKILIERLKPTRFTNERETYSLYIFPEENRFREICSWFVNQKWFDNVVLLFIGLNCITLAMERPNIPPTSNERYFLATANYVFTVVFTLEMFIKVVAAGMFYGHDAYFTSGWNIMDGSLVIISIIDLLMSLISESSPRIFGILRVFRLLRSLRPLRVINRAPGLKLVVQTLLSSLRPIGNIVLICCTFFIIFGILGVQLFKGSFYYCEGEHIKGVRNKTDCLAIDGNVWINRKYNFDDLGKALMSLFVLSSRDGWVNIMYTGLDAVGVDQQPIVNFNEWRLLYFIAFILLVGFFVLNMFVGVVVENFHRCREEQEKEEKIRRAAKRALQMEKKRRKMHEPPYYSKYSPTRMLVHNVVTSKYFDLAIAAVIGLNVVTMALEYYQMPVELEYALKIFNYFFTAVFILEAIMKVVALGIRLYMKDKWNQLDVGIVILSIVGIVLEELETNIIPINPTIIRVMRVLRIARVLKLLKMAKGIRALLDTVMQALPQVGNLGLLFFLLFFIFAALGVELFGRLECSEQIPCQGLGEHAHFANFGMAFLTLFRVATGDNWNGIMKDTLRDDCDDSADCVQNCCVSTIIAPIFFVIFVLMAQFVLVNVVVAVLMKHLEESHKQMEDEIDMETELERELVREQEFEEEQALCLELQKQDANKKNPLEKVSSLPSNFTYSTPSLDKKLFNTQRRQTIQYFNQTLGINEMGSSGSAICGGGDIGSIISCSGSNKQQKPLSSKLATAILIGNTNSCSNDKKNSNLLISDNKQNEDSYNDIFAAAAAAGGSEQLLNTARRMSRQEYNFPMPRLVGLSRRSSIIRAKMLQREQSLDEHGVRKRRLEKKRMSCDHLPWGSVSGSGCGGNAIDNEKRGTIFESTEGETGCGSANDDPNELLDIQSIKSDNCNGRKKMMLHSKLRTVSVDEKCLTSYYPGITDISSPVASTSGIKDLQQYPIKLQQPDTITTTTTTSTAQPPQPPPTITEQRPNKQFGRSFTIDHGQLGPPPRFLSVPTRSMPPRSRSGSTKQLFKQQAVDEDPDIDESSLLLPTSPAQKPQILHIEKSTSGLSSSNNIINNSPTDKIQDGLSKSDSAEILRIISERRHMEHRDNNGNEDSDYNELLLVKSQHSSMEA